ncbi:MAG: hypothetical protein E7520_05480 [Ruminococcaceae bacterium]|nr:hypothetical protein [Oscillospiraceae bacterium]
MQKNVGRDGDTVKLLRECDAGIKMGVSSIDDVIEDVRDSQFRTLLSECKTQHEKLGMEVGELLDIHADDGKNPNPIAKSMSWMKTEAKMMADRSDATIADLMTDGCNMGVKSLSRYLNQYKSADEKSKDICERLVNIELQLTNDIRQYL